MSLPSKGKLLRIFIGESDHWEGRPLYEAIVLEAKKRGLAGATVIKGFMGFGAASRIHTAKLLELSEDLPIVIEFVDAPEKIEAFIPEVDRMMGDGLITIETAGALLYRTGKHPRLGVQLRIRLVSADRHRDRRRAGKDRGVHSGSRSDDGRRPDYD